MKISDATLAILDRCTADGTVLRLPPGKLDRPVYEAVNKVLVAAGGKWNRRAAGHVFDGPAEDAIDPILLTGEVTNRKKEFGQFDTPPDVAARAVKLAMIGRNMRVLEPSVGNGGLAIPAAKAGGLVFGYEIDQKRLGTAIMTIPGFSPLGGDFMAARPIPEFDVVLMNPPFAKRADVHHVRHAINFLKPGGRLVAIMSASLRFRGDGLTSGLRVLIEHRGGQIEDLPDGSFVASGTSVNTVIVSFNVP